MPYHLATVPYEIGAGDEARTRYLHLGKVALYRMSYTRISCSAFAEQVGASGRNRTNDTRIFSPLLYLLSYRGIFLRCASGASLTAWVLYRRKGRLSTVFYRIVKILSYSKTKSRMRTHPGFLEVPPRFELGNEGFADLYAH